MAAGLVGSSAAERLDVMCTRQNATEGTRFHTGLVDGGRCNGRRVKSVKSQPFASSEWRVKILQSPPFIGRHLPLRIQPGRGEREFNRGYQAQERPPHRQCRGKARESVLLLESRWCLHTKREYAVKACSESSAYLAAELEDKHVCRCRPPTAHHTTHHQGCKAEE